jgi:glycosyltransferase involved in cell wall biosynthesis
VNKVKISVILLCFNEVKYIDRCLDSIFNFSPVEGGFEVAIADGLSNDGTRDILASWKQKKDELIIIDNPARITPVAMNLGIKAASGQYVIFLSSHVEYSQDLLIKCMSAFEKVEVDNVGGILITLPANNSLQARIVQAITTHRFGVGNSEFRVGTKEGYVDTVVYGCYKRAMFDRIGLLDERLVRNHDYEINRRLIKAGGKIWQDPTIKSYYYNQSTIRGLLLQAWSNGKWNPWMWYLAPYSFAPRHTIPGNFVFSLIFSFIIAAFFSWGWIIPVMILVPYLALAFISSYQQSLKYSWYLFPILPFMFFVYHISYGMGILWGCVNLLFGKAPVQKNAEPWPGAGRKRAWDIQGGRN